MWKAASTISLAMAFSVMAAFFSLSPRRQDAKNATRSGHRIAGMASIPELLDGHVTLEVECLDRLYLNGYIGSLATSGGLVTFMREQMGKPIPSPVVLGQVTEKIPRGSEGHDPKRARSPLPVR